MLRPDRPLRRALLLVGALVVVAVAGGGPSPARAAVVEPSPGASDPATTEPVSPEPTPGDPTPTDAPTPSPTPTTPAPTPKPTPTSTAPGTPAPTPGSPAPGTSGPIPAPGIDPWAPGPLLPALASPDAVAAPAFGVVYPTTPWIYNGLPGTRFLDAREGDGESAGRRHMGIDAQGGVRQPIFAAADGIVVDGTWGTTAKDGHGYGNQIVISHANGYSSRYAHLNESPVVRLGQRVAAGQLIGYMGGSQRGALHALPRHLHFEVMLDGRAVDPIGFLTGAVTSAAAGGTGTAAQAPAADKTLYEIRPRPDGSYTSISTGIGVSSTVFTTVPAGGESATILAIEDGRLVEIAVVDGAWTKTDSGVPLAATSMSGIVGANGYIELIAVEDGGLFHIAQSAAGWTKTATGHRFSGTVSAVRMPEGTLEALLQQSGYLYHLFPAEDGLWNVQDARLHVGELLDATSVDGAAPEAMAIIDGEMQRIVRDGASWTILPTGLPASGSIATVYSGGGWPVALTAELGGLGVARVEQRVWTRYLYDVTVPGPVDAVFVPGVGALLYSVG